MKKLTMLPIATALAMLGMIGSGNAFPDNATDPDGDDATPDAADIITLTATSDKDGGGAGIGEITVTMALQGASNLNGMTYRVHFDYTGDLATDHTPSLNGCEVGVKGTTSDDIMKTSRRKGVFKDTGPGMITGQGTATLTFIVGYDELSKGTGVDEDTDVLIWADTHQQKGGGIRDRAPDTDTSIADDDCSKPEQLSEVLAITTDPAGPPPGASGFPLAITFTPTLLIDQLLIEVGDSWLTDSAYALDIVITGINGGFALHGDDLIDVVDTNVFSTDGFVAQTVVDWTQDTIPNNVNEVYTVCVQVIRNNELFGDQSCVAFGPF